MLANGSDLRIINSSGTVYDLILDPRVDNHWDHHFESLLGPQQGSGALLGWQNIRPDKRIWRMTDWSGGENARYFRPTDPTQYDYAATGHGRLPGIIKGTPTVTAGSYTPDALPARAQMVVADGVLWIVADRVDGAAITAMAAKSSDASTWSTVTLTSPGTSYNATAATGGNDGMYYAMSDNTASPNIDIRRAAADGTITDMVNISTGTSSDIKAMALSGPYLYTISGGGKVRQWVTNGTLPDTTGDVIHTVSADLTVSGTNVMMVTGDTSVFIMVSRSGNTEIDELSAPSSANVVGALIWGGPQGGLQGFTGTALGYADGVIYLAGYYGDGTTNRACLYGMSNTERTPVRVGYFRVENASTASLEPRWISPGEGGQVLIGMKSGQVFVYDKDADSISLLDVQLLWTALDATASFAGKRVALFRNTSNGTLKTNAWSDDYASTTSGFDLFSPTWDYDLPYLKQLSSIEVEYKPITGSETIIIKYQLDESGSYTALTTLNSSSTGAAQGRTTLTGSTVASMKTFRKISFEFVGTGGAELRDASAVSEILDYVEVMDAAILIKDQDTTARPSNRQRSGQALLDLFFNASTGLQRTKALVTLRNGAETPVPSDTANTGYVESVVRVSDARFVRRKLTPKQGATNKGLDGTLYVRFTVEP